MFPKKWPGKKTTSYKLLVSSTQNISAIDEASQYLRGQLTQSQVSL